MPSAHSTNRITAIVQSIAPSFSVADGAPVETELLWATVVPGREPRDSGTLAGRIGVNGPGRPRHAGAWMPQALHTSYESVRKTSRRPAADGPTCTTGGRT